MNRTDYTLTTVAQKFLAPLGEFYLLGYRGTLALQINNVTFNVPAGTRLKLPQGTQVSMTSSIAFDDGYLLAVEAGEVLNLPPAVAPATCQYNYVSLVPGNTLLSIVDPPGVGKKVHVVGWEMGLTCTAGVNSTELEDTNANPVSAQFFINSGQVASQADRGENGRDLFTLPDNIGLNGHLLGAGTGHATWFVRFWIEG